jgi:serpin B
MRADSYSFAAILPDEGIDIADFIADMSGENLAAMLNSAHQPSGGVRAALPKFSFEYDIEMNEMLIAMGMPTAFSPPEADFSRLGEFEGENLYIGFVKHKTFIDVDEVGTRAAAVTCVGIVRTTTVAPQPVPVILDRPFVFAIVDNTTNLPVFIGALTEIP